jgi:transposase
VLTSAEFVAFLTDIVVNQPRGKEIHVIADNLSAHKTQQVDAFLVAHPKVHLHFTPTYSSWLNQVELWFAKIERDIIARGVFTSVSDLKRKTCAISGHYNKQPKPVKWKYFDPTRRITPESIVTVPGGPTQQTDAPMAASIPATSEPLAFSAAMSLTAIQSVRRSINPAAAVSQTAGGHAGQRRYGHMAQRSH